MYGAAAKRDLPGVEVDWREKHSTIMSERHDLIRMIKAIQEASYTNVKFSTRAQIYWDKIFA